MCYEYPYKRKGTIWSNRRRCFVERSVAEKDNLMDDLDEEKSKAREKIIDDELRKIIGSDERHIGPP